MKNETLDTLLKLAKKRNIFEEEFIHQTGDMDFTSSETTKNLCVLIKEIEDISLQMLKILSFNDKMFWECLELENLIREESYDECALIKTKIISYLNNKEQLVYNQYEN